MDLELIVTGRVQSEVSREGRPHCWFSIFIGFVDKDKNIHQHKPYYLKLKTTDLVGTQLFTSVSCHVVLLQVQE